MVLFGVEKHSHSEYYLRIPFPTVEDPDGWMYLTKTNDTPEGFERVVFTNSQDALKALGVWL